MNRIIISALSSLALLAGFTSCSDDLDAPRVADPDGRITFTISTTGGWTSTDLRSGDAAGAPVPSVESPLTVPFRSADGQQLYAHITMAPDQDAGSTATRGSMVNSADDVESIGLIGYRYSGGSFSFAGATPAEGMDNIKLVKKGDHWEAESADLYWPGGSDRLIFLAYSPYKPDSENIRFVVNDDGVPSLTYNCADDPALNEDLLVAVSDVAAAGADPVALNFRHPLATILFRGAKFDSTDDSKGFIACQVTSLQVGDDTNKPFLRSNTFSFDNSANGGAWAAAAVDATRMAMAMTMPADGNGVQGSADRVINSGSQAFMIIPEPAMADAETAPVAPLGLSLKVGSTEITSDGLKIPILAREGYITTYYISNRQKLTVDDARLAVNGDLTFPYYGTFEPGNNGADLPRKLNVESFGTVAGNPDQPLAWTAVVTDENGNPCDWISFPESGVGSEDIFISVNKTEPVTVEAPHTTALRSTPAVHDHDLSMETGSCNTANCYIINAPGTYRLPLVYGNAIKNGATNTTCGLGDASFVNHLGNRITDPKISGAASALVLWQDVKAGEEIVSVDADITTGGDYDYLTFTVDPATIKQANAVVAVRDADGKVMWSWHLWITDYKLGTELVTVGRKDGEKFQLMPYTLGYCAGPNPQYYPARTATITITQSVSGKTATFTVNQQYFETAPNNNTPLYQWGRKDPFVASTNNKPADNQVYDPSVNTGGYLKHYTAASGFEFRTDNTTAAATKNAILNPNVFYFKDNLWYGNGKTVQNNLWDTDFESHIFSKTSGNNTIALPSKTLYDPSPVGFSIPSTHVFFHWCNISSKHDDHARPGIKLSPFNSTTIANPYNGAWLFCNGEDSEDGLFFYPASGRRNKGVMTDHGKYCMSWNSGISSNGGNRFRVGNNNGSWDSGDAGFLAVVGCAALSVKNDN